MVAVTAGELSPIVTRHRLLRRDPRLPGRVRAAPRAGVDRRAHALVRRAARDGRVHRPLPRAPRRDHAAAAARGRTRWRRRGAPASASPRGRAPRRPAQALLPPGRGPPPARRARRGRGGLPGGEPARAGSRSPGLALLRLAQGDADAAAAAIRRALAETTERSRGARLLPALRRDHARRRATSRRRATPAPSSRRSPRLRGAACSGRWPRRPRRGRRWPRATRGRRWPRCAAPGSVWQELEAPYEAARARVLRRARLPGAAATRTRAALELEAARGVFAELGAAPDLARVDALGRAAARPTRTG